MGLDGVEEVGEDLLLVDGDGGEVGEEGLA